jgi:hypothetical protein
MGVLNSNYLLIMVWSTLLRMNPLFSVRTGHSKFENQSNECNGFPIVSVVPNAYNAFLFLHITYHNCHGMDKLWKWNVGVLV